LSGRQERGFKFNVGIAPSQHIDDPLAKQVILRAVRRLKMGHAFEQELREDWDITGIIPIFNVRNYTVDELYGKVSRGRGRTPAGQRFGGLLKLHGGPEGGELRSSLHTQAEGVDDRTLLFETTWYSDYLAYLVQHGKSRQAGTTTQFAEKIYKSITIPDKLRNLMRTIMRELGFTEKQVRNDVTISKAGMVIR